MAGPGQRRACGRRWQHALADGDRGTSPIELAILLPVIITALFASIQVSVYFLARAEAAAAAQECVTVQRSYAVASNPLDPAKQAAGHDAAVAWVNSGNAGRWLTLKSVTCATNPTGSIGVTGTVTGNAPSLIPFFHVFVSVTAHGPQELPAPPVPTPSISQPPPGPPVPTP
jgi:Flp pilus assembly protein TadG